MVPVNLRPIEEAYKLGNHFGLAPVVLPIGLDNPIERVYEVRRRMKLLKGSMQPLLAFATLAVAGTLVKSAQEAVLNMFSKNHSGDDQCAWSCSKITNVWFNTGANLVLGAAKWQRRFGCVDIELRWRRAVWHHQRQHLVPQPAKIIDEFEPEFAKLSLVTLMLPWGNE